MLDELCAILAAFISKCSRAQLLYFPTAVHEARTPEDWLRRWAFDWIGRKESTRITVLDNPRRKKPRVSVNYPPRISRLDLKIFGSNESQISGLLVLLISCNTFV